MEMRTARDFFYSVLELPHQNNMYYSIFHLNGAAPIEEKLVSLAKRGVIYIPAYLFFHEDDRKERDLRNAVRVSFVNAAPAKVRRAAEITRSYLTGA